MSKRRKRLRGPDVTFYIVGAFNPHTGQYALLGTGQNRVLAQKVYDQSKFAGALNAVPIIDRVEAAF